MSDKQPQEELEGALTPKGEAIKVAVAAGCDEYSFSEGWNAAMNTRASTTQPDSRCPICTPKAGWNPCADCQKRIDAMNPAEAWANIMGNQKPDSREAFEKWLFDTYGVHYDKFNVFIAARKHGFEAGWNTHAALSQPKEGAGKAVHEWKYEPNTRTTPVKCLLCDSESVVVVYTPQGCTCSPNKYQPRCEQHLSRAIDTGEEIYIIEDFRIPLEPESQKP